ncbi:hypothetical protein I316_06360 [Kwoniella heveanensis BCC8398]|uniref:Exonuclease domain-containing protein n=1 Tax=Kwoniella heveanensis BCC8398 TaxID=1296120 RepID=A0A1B9GM79_9TREE|nr:hypothetical protein I316_06360 [Kwoniella heveanensis BCC8398]
MLILSISIVNAKLNEAPTFEQIIPQIKEIIKDKILVGHALFNDLAAIKYRQPYESFRDTAIYLPLRQLMGVTRDGECPSLKKLSKEVLGVDIQANGGKGHDPIEDARTTMSIFLSVRDAYETSLLRNEDVISGIPP